MLAGDGQRYGHTNPEEIDRGRTGRQERRKQLIKNIARRLERLEARARSAQDPISILIHFVNAEKRVTSTLLIKSGKQVWTESGEANENVSPPPTPKY